MILFQRFVPLVSTLFTGALWWAAILWPQYYVYWVIAIIFVCFFSLAQLFEWRIFTREFLAFFSPILFLHLSLALFFLFLGSNFFRYFSLLLTLLAHAIFFESCFTYLHHAKGYQPYALANISSFIHLFTLWFFFSAVFGFLTFLQFSPWIFLVVVPVVVFIVTLEMYRMYNIPLRQSVVFILMMSITFSEIFFAFSFLPLSWLVSGLAMVCVYFLFSYVGRYYLLKSLDSAIVIRYASLTFCLLAILFLTAQWI